jgi:hypothetical protein
MYLGTNCLTAFIVTPIIGNHLNLIGVKFAYCAGMLFGEKIPYERICVGGTEYRTVLNKLVASKVVLFVPNR